MPRADMNGSAPSRLRGRLVVGLLFFGLTVACANVDRGSLSMGMKAKRSEAVDNLKRIAEAERWYYAVFDGLIAVGSRAEATAKVEGMKGRALRDWERRPAWEQLGWRPDGQVRGAYWVELSPDGEDFTAYGVINVDGDEDIAEFRVHRTGEVYLVTEGAW